MSLKETPIESSFLGFVKKAACPACGTILGKSLGTARTLCSSCGDYAWFGEKTLRAEDPATVEALPLFAAPLPWTDMRAPTFGALVHPVAALTDMILTKKAGVRLVEARWPDGCCVCGKPATREETISQQVGFTPPSGGVMAGGQKEATVVARGVPHCAEHQGGARFERVLSFGDLDLMTLGLFFRSYGYQIRFRKQNPWKWRG
jgi:hypothetical protein